MMSLNVFLAFCILGVAFMMYALFQWTYGDKRSVHGRRLPARKDALPLPANPEIVNC
jgi:hypothetical protein